MAQTARVKVLPPAEEIDPDADPYVPREPTGAPLSGYSLAAYTAAYEGPLGRALYERAAAANGLHRILHEVTVPEQPLFRPHYPVKEAEPEEPGCAQVQGETAFELITTLVQQGWTPELHLNREPAKQPVDVPEPASAEGEGAPVEQAARYRRPTIADYVAAYRSGSTTPVEALERIIAAIERSSKAGLGWFISSDADDIREQARASTERWAAGKPLSFLDGVPFAVKDVVHAEPYKTTAGTAFGADKWATGGTAPYVASLKGLGAILLGKNTMHEIGMGGTGFNLRTGTAHNPYNLAHTCGGSSSGSAAVLAAGIAPITIGTDGGGSIRGPAHFSGVTGLKPTTGRVSIKGCVKVDCTVATLGPMGATVQDVALLYTVLANFDQWVNPGGERMPAARLPKPLAPATAEQLLKGRKAGVYWEWFRDADPDVVAACTAAVALLESEAGLEVKHVRIAELGLARAAHGVTISSEMQHNFQPFVEDPKLHVQFNADVRLGLDTARFLTPADYLQAQRIRARATVHWRRAFQGIDVLFLPTAAITAPPIPKAILQGAGYRDPALGAKIGRFTPIANFLGLTGISVPVGVDSNGLPIGLQVIGRPWNEATVLRYAAVLEKALAERAKRGGTGPVAGVPKVWIDPLTGASAGFADNK